MKKEQNLNLNLIFKILYKNLFLILLTTIVITIISIFYIVSNKSYKSEIILYSNDRVLTEIGESSQYSLTSFDFFRFIKENSNTLNNKNLNDEKFLKDMSKRLTSQSEVNIPIVKVKFTTKSEKEGDEFSKDFSILAQKFLQNRKNNFLNNQLKLLEEQYNFIVKNTDIKTVKDPLTDTLISRLSYYRLLKNDNTPLVKLISISVKPAINKKIVTILAFFTGIFLGIIIAFIKEFSKTVDWKNIKNSNN